MVSKDFILAGDAVFAIRGPDKERVYRVRLKPARGEYGVAYFVYTKVDGGRFVYLGILNVHSAQVRTTENSKTWTETKRLKLLNRILIRIWANDHQAYEAHGYDVRHLGRCGRCGRELRDAPSLATGLGPECTKRLEAPYGKEKKNRAPRSKIR
jgi:hypothetical protein